FRENSSTPILDAMARFFSQHTPNEAIIKQSKSGKYITFNDLPRMETYEPRCIYSVLGLINNECLKGRQEDAEEFLSSLLNGVHEEMLHLTEKKSSTAAASSSAAVNGSTESAGELSQHNSSGYASNSEENLNRVPNIKDDTNDQQ